MSENDIHWSHVFEALSTANVHDSWLTPPELLFKNGHSISLHHVVVPVPVIDFPSFEHDSNPLVRRKSEFPSQNSSAAENVESSQEFEASACLNRLGTLASCHLPIWVNRTEVVLEFLKMLLPVAHQLAATIFVVENVRGDASLALLDLGASAEGAVLSTLRDVKIEVADAPARLVGSSLQCSFDGDPSCLVLVRNIHDYIHGPLRKIGSSSWLWADFLAVLLAKDLRPSHGAIHVELGLVRVPSVDLPKLEHNLDLVVGG